MNRDAWARDIDPLLRSLWPQLGDPDAWFSALGHHEPPTLVSALTAARERLGARPPEVSAVRAVVDATLGTTEAATLVLTAPKTSVDESLEAFDALAATVRTAAKTEIRDFARRYGGGPENRYGPEWVAERCAAIDAVGPMEARARRIAAGEEKPGGDSLAAFIATLTSEQERRANPARRALDRSPGEGAAPADTAEAAPPPPVAAGQPSPVDRTRQVQEQAEDIVRRLRGGEQIHAAQITDEAVRTRVRQLLAEERERRDQHPPADQPPDNDSDQPAGRSE